MRMMKDKGYGVANLLTIEAWRWGDCVLDVYTLL